MNLPAVCVSTVGVAAFIGAGVLNPDRLVGSRRRRRGSMVGLVGPRVGTELVPWGEAGNGPLGHRQGSAPAGRAQIGGRPVAVGSPGLGA